MGCGNSKVSAPKLVLPTPRTSEAYGVSSRRSTTLSASKRTLPIVGDDDSHDDDDNDVYGGEADAEPYFCPEPQCAAQPLNNNNNTDALFPITESSPADGNSSSSNNNTPSSSQRTNGSRLGSLASPRAGRSRILSPLLEEETSAAEFFAEDLNREGTPRHGRSNVNLFVTTVMRWEPSEFVSCWLDGHQLPMPSVYVPTPFTTMYRGLEEDTLSSHSRLVRTGSDIEAPIHLNIPRRSHSSANSLGSRRSLMEVDLLVFGQTDTSITQRACSNKGTVSNGSNVRRLLHEQQRPSLVSNLSQGSKQ
eukprot:PhM_4_TR9120/c0_g1_i1/m.87067